jgi:hypothetical protein
MVVRAQRDQPINQLREGCDGYTDHRDWRSDAAKPSLLAKEGLKIVVVRKYSIKQRGRQKVVVMQPAKDRFGADGVRFFAAVARTGVSEVENSRWWIRNTWGQHMCGRPAL